MTHDMRLIHPGRQKEFKNLMRRAVDLSKMDAADQYDSAAGAQREAEIREITDKFTGDDEA